MVLCAFLFFKKIIYLNCASRAPLLKNINEIGVKALALKLQPWNITDSLKDVQSVRESFANLIKADSEDISIGGSTSYNLAAAANNMKYLLCKKSNVVVVEGQMASNVYPWQTICFETGAQLKVVKRIYCDDSDINGKSDCDLTSNIINAIDEFTVVTALPFCMWSDGKVL
eukprot:Pgem_evm1s8144